MSRVAIQGVRGAFSHLAASSAVGREIDVVECARFEDLFEAVLEGSADLGAVPVENSLAGSVARAMDLLVAHPLHVVGETRVRVRLCLAAPPGARVADLRTVASHPVALEQCHGFFARHPEVRPVAAFDTAGSVRDMMAGRAEYDGAIGSELAAELYGARVLERELEDDPHNFTRFLLVASTPGSAPEEGAKTSLVFEVRHEPGSLHTALGALRRHGVDLTRLESRPLRGRRWEYRFYADMRGPSARVQAEAVRELESVAEQVRVLGTYPERTADA